MNETRIREGMKQLAQILAGAAESNAEVGGILEALFTIGGTVYLTGVKAYGSSGYAVRVSVGPIRTQVDLVARSGAEEVGPMTLEEWRVMAAERRREAEEEL